MSILMTPAGQEPVKIAGVEARLSETVLRGMPLGLGLVSAVGMDLPYERIDPHLAKHTILHERVVPAEVPDVLPPTGFDDEEAADAPIALFVEERAAQNATRMC